MQKRITIGVICSLIYLFFEGISQILLAPILLKNYSPDQVGIWFLVANFVVFIQFGQAGLGPVTVRSLARAAALGADNWQHEYRLAGRAYKYVVSAFIPVLIGTGIYVANAGRTAVSFNPQWLWAPFACGLLLRIYAWRWLNALNGLGYLGSDKAMLAANSFVCFGAYWILANQRMPLWTLSFAYAGIGGLFLFFSAVLYRSIAKSAPQLATADCTHGQKSGYTRSIRDYFAESGQFFILNISGLFVMNADLIITERLFGPSKVVYFGVLVKLGFLVISVGSLLQNMLYPYIAKDWACGNFACARKHYSQGLIISLAISGLVCSGMFAAAPFIIPLWLGPGGYLGAPVFALQLLFAMISVHTIAQATPALATGEVQFMDLAIISALLSVPLSYWLGANIGIAGIAAGNAIATLLPSAWHGLRARRLFYVKRPYASPEGAT